MGVISAIVGEHIRDYDLGLFRSQGILHEDTPERYENGVFDHGYGNVMYKRLKEQVGELTVMSLNERQQLILLGFNEFIRGHTEDELKAISLARIIEGLKSADGEYICFLADGVEGCLHVINDRWASRPCYIKKEREGIVVSTNLALLLRLSREENKFDKVGLLQILNYNHTIGRRTNMEGVSRLMPATHLQMHRGKVYEDKYWELTYTRGYNSNPKQQADEIFETFRESVVRRARGRKGFVSLSGGLDSRMVAYNIPKEDYFCFTFADSVDGDDTPELSCAKKVANALSLKHRISILRKSEISDRIADIVMLTGGLVSIQHPVKTMQYIDTMEKYGVHLGGGPGDVLAGSYIPHYVHTQSAVKNWLRIRIKYLSRRLILGYCKGRANYSYEKLSDILGGEAVGRYAQQVSDSLIASFNGINERTAGQSITKWAMTIRQPAFTFTSPVHNYPGVIEFSPHLGYAYADRMLELGQWELQDKNMYKFVLYRGMPELREVEYANTGRVISSELIRHNYGESLEAKTAARPNTYLENRFHYDLIKNDKVLLGNIRATIKAGINGLDDLINPEKVVRFIDDFEQGKIRITRNLDANIMGWLGTVCYTQKLLLLGKPHSGA